MNQPSLPPWIEKSHYITGAWVKRGEVWSFKFIAAVTRQCEITEVIGTPVLARDNVFDLEFLEGRVLLPYSAIFALIVSPLPN